MGRRLEQRLHQLQAAPDPTMGPTLAPLHGALQALRNLLPGGLPSEPPSQPAPQVFPPLATDAVPAQPAPPAALDLDHPSHGVPGAHVPTHPHPIAAPGLDWVPPEPEALDLAWPGPALPGVASIRSLHGTARAAVYPPLLFFITKFVSLLFASPDQCRMLCWPAFARSALVSPSLSPSPCSHLTSTALNFTLSLLSIPRYPTSLTYTAGYV